MKNILIILVSIMLPLVIQAQDMKTMEMDKKPAKEESNATTYTCPMHPDIHEPKPGNCPKCSMKLVPEKTKKQTKISQHKEITKKQADQVNTAIQDNNNSTIAQKNLEKITHSHVWFDMTCI